MCIIAIDSDLMEKMPFHTIKYLNKHHHTICELNGDMVNATIFIGENPSMLNKLIGKKNPKWVIWLNLAFDKTFISKQIIQCTSWYEVESSLDIVGKMIG